MPDRLTRNFYERDVVRVARGLLGQRLVRIVEDKRVSGIIVETEAYLGLPDKAAHTFNGRRTQRNESMFGPGGTAYVYFTYGMHYCMNVVAQQPDEPVAVLLRALEPDEGVDAMRLRRPKVSRDTLLCSGPARLTQALAINRANDGTDLCESDEMFIEQLRGRALADSQIVTTTRVGVAYAKEWAEKPLRFYIAGSEHVSRK
jgi:DNA-3-methyladenine glycosylase